MVRLNVISRHSINMYFYWNHTVFKGGSMMQNQILFFTIHLLDNENQVRISINMTVTCCMHVSYVSHFSVW